MLIANEGLQHESQAVIGATLNRSETSMQERKGSHLQNKEGMRPSAGVDLFYIDA